MRDQELRDQIANLFPPKVFMAHRDNIADAVIELIGPILEGLGAAHYTPYVDEEHQGGYCYDLMVRLLAGKFKVERERDLLLWLHAEAVWQRDGVRVIADQFAVEIGRLRREVEFEAHGERWDGMVVAPDGHELANGFGRCACGESIQTLGEWSRHHKRVREAAAARLCACITDEQAANLAPGFFRPVCAVHPEGSAE